MQTLNLRTKLLFDFFKIKLGRLGFKCGNDWRKSRWECVYIPICLLIFIYIKSDVTECKFMHHTNKVSRMEEQKWIGESQWHIAGNELRLTIQLRNDFF